MTIEMFFGVIVGVIIGEALTDFVKKQWDKRIDD
jgi:hypothetical protein